MVASLTLLLGLLGCENFDRASFVVVKHVPGEVEQPQAIDMLLVLGRGRYPDV